jgi:hypothetical protein
MRLRYVEIESFMGIQSAKFAVGEGGVQFVGKSRSGKSSMANAVHACLKSREYGPECIHDGAEQWRVLLKFDEATVQTIVRKNGRKTVNVDGLGIGSPQAKLDAVFPDLIDPWKLAQDKPEDRRRKVLAAMPAVATESDFMRWTGDKWEPMEGVHGLDMVKRAHDHYYTLRTAANAAVDAAKAACKLAQDETQRLASPAHKGVVVPPPGEEDAPVLAAQKEVEALEQRRLQSEEMAKRTEGTRARIAESRAKADQRERTAPAGVEAIALTRLTEETGRACDEVTRLEGQLAEAKIRKQRAITAQNEAVDQNERHDKAIAEANKLRDQAGELEATLAEASIEPPTLQELADADQALFAAQSHADLVRAARKEHDAHVRLCVLTDELDAAKVEAKRLNDIVVRLDNDAPAELAARANMIQGLTFVDDDIALDGHVFKVISESEKTELCVDLVKRIAPEAKLLRIDKLEGMDPDLREDFIRKAKAGGWQIIGTVVERGEMRIVAIDADDESGAISPEQTAAADDVTPLNPKRRVKVVKDGREVG